MQQVCVVYEETGTGRRSLRMALDVARLLGGHSLQVFVPADTENAHLLGTYAPGADRTTVERVTYKLYPVAYKQPFEVRTFPANSKPPFPAGSLVVGRSVTDASTCANRRTRPNYDTLMPANESKLEGRRKGPILVPFSDGDTGLVAAARAFELVKQWRKTRELPKDEPEVILYHTTWQDNRARSSDPLDQMCVEAIRVMLALEAAAEEAGVRYRTVVETHDDVVQGVIEMAQATGSVLVLMARGAQIRQGSYVERMLEQSPIPVLVANAATEPVAAPADDDRVQAYNANRREILRLAALQPRKPWYKRVADLPVLRSPLFVTGVVASLYVLKAIAKIGVGGWINSPTITGDGFHNIGDVLEAVAIGIVLLIAVRSAGGRYPYGRKNMEWFTSLAIGVMLFTAAGKFIVDCVVGLLSFVPALDSLVRSTVSLPAYEAVNLDGTSLPWVLAVTICSFMLSLVLSRYQIIIGKRTGHASLVANGEETASDGWIEAVTVVGVIAQFLTGWRILEYILGLLVAVMIMRTAKELFVAGWRVLLQHALADQHEKAIHAACMSVSDVEFVKELKTFQVGHTAVVMVTCESLSEAQGMTYVKKAVEAAIRNYLLTEDSEFKGCDIHVKMQRPDPGRHRIGYAVVMGSDGGVVLAPTIPMATHIAVCDVEHNQIVRSKLLPVTESIAAMSAEKRIQRLYVLHPGGGTGRLLEQGATYTLQTLGLKV
jgi:cation diffusion facilitator family transporter